MKAEEKLVSFIHEARFRDIPSAALQTVKHQVLAVIGTTIAGATADLCETAVQLYRELGGNRRRQFSSMAAGYRPRMRHSSMG